MASPRDPELDVAAAAMVAAAARFVVIGGFAVIANRFVRATEDIDFLVPDDPANDRRVLAALCALRAVRQRDDAPPGTSICSARVARAGTRWILLTSPRSRIQGSTTAARWVIPRVPVGEGCGPGDGRVRGECGGILAGGTRG
jgi:hypothetical protein